MCMWACHRCDTDIVIQLVASAALHESLYPATSHSKPLRLPTPNLRSRSMLMALNRRARMIAVRPSSKKRAVVLRLLASQQVSREPGRLHGMGLYKIYLTGYCTALVVVERATMCSAVQPFRLASRAVLLHEGPASLSSDGSGGIASVERRSWIHCQVVARGGARGGSWVFL